MSKVPQVTSEVKYDTRDGAARAGCGGRTSFRDARHNISPEIPSADDPRLRRLGGAFVAALCLGSTDRGGAGISFVVFGGQRREKDLGNEIQFRAEWADSDPAGIAFYPNFFKCFDLGTWNRRVGPYARSLARRVQRDRLPDLEARSRFLRQVRFWDAVTLVSEVTAWSRKTFQISHTVKVDGSVCAEGVEIRMCARTRADVATSLEAVSIPDVFRRRLEGSA